MKKLFVLCVLSFSFLAAEEAFKESSEQKPPPNIRNSFGHFDIGLGPFPIPLPSFALGYRNQWGHHGNDIVLYTSTIVCVTQVKGNFLYHYYFKPNLKSQFYVGGGAGVSGLFLSKKSMGHTKLCLSPEFVLGKEYQNSSGDRRFIQMQVSFPTYCFPQKPLYFPLVVFSYGIGF